MAFDTDGSGITVGTREIRVLHVDDEPDFAETAAAFLERENPGVEVVTVADVESALERIETGDVDCVVSNSEMPETGKTSASRSSPGVTAPSTGWSNSSLTS